LVLFEHTFERGKWVRAAEWGLSRSEVPVVVRSAVLDPPRIGRHRNARNARNARGELSEGTRRTSEERCVMPPAMTTAPDRRRDRTVASSASHLLAMARHGLHEAATSSRPAERYASAHLAALRCAAAVLAARARPDVSSSRRSRRPRNAWSLLTEVAPELAEWATFFAAGASKRAAAEAGIEGAVTAREADDILRDAETFLALAETTIGLAHQASISWAVRAS
jgi:SAV_6107-like HEPN